MPQRSATYMQRLKEETFLKKSIANCVHWIAKAIKNNVPVYLTILVLQMRAQPDKLDSQLWLSASEADQP